jgi:CRP-like cAMP-binding protein
MAIEHLRDVSIFKDLSDAELEAMTHLWALHVVPAHQRIVAEGEPMHHFHIVRSGLVHVRRLSQKHEVLLARIGRGGFFGEINIFEESTATASVYALDETRIASVENFVFRAFLAQHPDIGYKVTARLLNELSARLRQTNELLVNSMFWSTTHLK